eukprot:6342884-Pyramimonas_sp.AAC.1
MSANAQPIGESELGADPEASAALTRSQSMVRQLQHLIVYCSIILKSILELAHKRLEGPLVAL